VADASYSSGGAGTDRYTDTDNVNAATQTENDKLTGSDSWTTGNSGSYHQNADGTYTSSNTTTQHGSGNDLYSGNGTQTAGSVTPLTDGGVGTTAMIDFASGSDTGTDRYAASGT